MNDRCFVHAVWASCVMYSVAIVCLSAVVIQRPTETGEAVAAKLLALFGPLTVLLSAILFRRNGSPPNPQ